MNRLLADDFVRFPGPSLGAGKINLMPEVVSEVESELFESLALNGSTADYDEIESEIFDALGIGLSGPVGDFFKGAGQAVFNVARGGRNLVRAVFQKPPLPTYNLRNGQLNTALDPKTTVSVGQDGIRVGGELIAPAAEVQSAYNQGYSDAGGGAAGSGGGNIGIPGIGNVPVLPVAIAGGAGLLLVLLLRK